jgi:Carboxypeptidase regulatory-like domain
MRAVTLVVAVMSTVSCGDDPGGSPRPTSPVSPTPPAQTWTLSGTVTETAPTTSTRIAGATITAVAGLDADGASVTTDANGGFHLAALAAGTYTIRTRAANYVESSQPLTLAANQTLAIQLDPVFQTVTTSSRDVVIGHPSCPGGWDIPECEIPRTATGEPCAVDYPFNVHHDGTVEVALEWADRRFGLATELCDADEGRATAQALTRPLEGAGYNVFAHRKYVIRVRSLSNGGGPPPAGRTEFTLTVTHPN